MPDSSLFTYGENTPIGKRCNQHHFYGDKHTQAQLCRIGKDTTSPPSCFLFGDSLSMVLSNAFNELDAPGMFAAHDGFLCPTIIRPNMKSTPSKLHAGGCYFCKLLFVCLLLSRIVLLYVNCKGFPCDRLLEAVIDFINKTSSIKSIYLAALWDFNLSDTVLHFEHTLKFYLSMNLRVYVIQQAPINNIPSQRVINVYKSLLDSDRLTNANLNAASVSRKDYIRQQARWEEFFSKFKKIRGMDYIYIEDVICDADVCSICTGGQQYFADNKHMTIIGALRLKTRFQKYIRN